MADIVEPDVTTFMNEKIRPSADLLVGFAQDIDVMIEEWTETILPLITANADSDLIFDGSETDGRTQLDKEDLVDVATALSAIRTAITPARFSTLVKAHVNVRHL